MPYCERCAKYWTPTSLESDGTCPTCGRQLETTDQDGAAPDEIDEGVPWHFKLMVVALVVYLGWRFAELGIELFN